MLKEYKTGYAGDDSLRVREGGEKVLQDTTCDPGDRTMPSSGPRRRRPMKPGMNRSELLAILSAVARRRASFAARWAALLCPSPAAPAAVAFPVAGGGVGVVCGLTGSVVRDELCRRWWRGNWGWRGRGDVKNRFGAIVDELVLWANGCCRHEKRAAVLARDAMVVVGEGEQ